MDRLSYRFPKLIFDLIYASLVFTLVYMLGLVIDLELNILLQIIIVLVGSLIIKFFILNPLFLYALLAISILGSVLVHRFITPFLTIVGNKLFYLIDNVIGNLQGKENIASDNILLLWCVLIVLISSYTAFILYRNKNIHALLPIYLGLFIIYWYNFFDEAYVMISIFLLLFFVLMALDKYYKARQNTQNNTNCNLEHFYSSWLKTATLYSVLIVSIALLLPKSNSSIEWSWLNHKIYTIFPGIENLRSSNSYDRGYSEPTLFSFSTTGYQENPSKLGGPVNLSDKKIMTVYSNESLYLRGNVKHTYTGDTWKSIPGSLKNYSLKQDFSGLSKYEKDNYHREINITIINHSFASTTIFSPYRPAEVNSKDDHVVNVSRDNILYFPDGIYNRESYTVKVQKPLPYGILLSRRISERKERIYNLEKYLQVPEDRITERTKALVKEIVKDAQGDFQKAIAIESYLRNNFEYSLKVSKVPEDREFIDYFLFTEKKGYCTYFATTMAIMLRLEGIPSRYVEGYLTQETEEPGVFEVRQKNAHAWVEAFIEPVGWMTFEPTPIYPVESRLENYRPAEIENEEISTNGINNYIKLPIEEHSFELINEGEYAIDNENSSDYNELQDEKYSLLRKRAIDIILIALLLFIPVKFLIGIFKYIYRESNVKKLKNNERIIYLYEKILKLMTFLGYPQEPGETHYEYADRIAYKFYIHNVKGIQEITDIFVRSKYSSSSASDDDVLDLVNYRRILEKRLKNHWHPIIYYYRKYVKSSI